MKSITKDNIAEIVAVLHQIDFLKAYEVNMSHRVRMDSKDSRFTFFLVVGSNISIWKDWNNENVASSQPISFESFFNQLPKPKQELLLFHLDLFV